MKINFLLLLLLSIVAIAPGAVAQVGQSSATSTSTGDTLRTIRKDPYRHELPPSIRAELARGRISKRQAISYHDTLRTVTGIATDTGGAIYHDSTLSFNDTLVTLTQKEWLDSQLVEIPEILRIGGNIRYNYPNEIMLETERRAVPFDSSQVQAMNPIARENLPFFDQSPIPIPLRRDSRLEGFLEGGGGNLFLPHAQGFLGYTIGHRSALAITGLYDVRSSNAVHQFYDFTGHFESALGPDPGIDLFKGHLLTLNVFTSGKSVDFINGKSSPILSHRLSNTGASAGLDGDITSRFHYSLLVHDSQLLDDLDTIMKESTLSFRGKGEFDTRISHYRIGAEYAFDNTSSELDSLPRPLPSSSALAASSASFYLGQRQFGIPEWSAGITYLHSGTNTRILPMARLRIELNPRWEIGGTFDPRVTLVNHAGLLAVNPFFSTFEAFRTESPTASSADRSALLEPRSAMMDRIHLTGFMNYMLSQDDELRTSVSFITRSDEPVFGLDTSKSIFTVSHHETRRLIIEASANFLFFDRDVFSASAEIHSATLTDSNSAIPYEPTLQLHASYRFNSINSWLKPYVEFSQISRNEKALNFLGAGADLIFSHSLSILIRAENILSGPSDFWTGYTERPRSVLGSVRYVF